VPCGWALDEKDCVSWREKYQRMKAAGEIDATEKEIEKLVLDFTITDMDSLLERLKASTKMCREMGWSN